jgi:hypothetical protein
VSTKKIVDTSRITPHQVKRGDRDAYPGLAFVAFVFELTNALSQLEDLILG